MTTTLYIQNIPITLPGCAGGRARIEDAVRETLLALGIQTPCTHVRNMRGDRLKMHLAIPGETYIADWPGCKWQETLTTIKKETRGLSGSGRRRSADGSGDFSFASSGVGLDIDLPSNVIRSIDQLNDSELRPSIFGGCSNTALLRAKVVEKQHFSDLAWVKRSLHAGIPIRKCARRNYVITTRVLFSNQTFTVFLIKGGRHLKKVPVSDITALINGKASPELEKTSSSISPQNCLCLQTAGRFYSLILPSMEDRDHLARGLEVLLGREVVEQDNIL